MFQVFSVATFFVGEQSAPLLVQTDRQQRFLNGDLAVVFDEAELPEFIHEEIHTGTRGPNHFRAIPTLKLRHSARGN